MDTSTCNALFSRHGIKATANRLLVIKALANEQYPLSIRELGLRMVTLDKSSIFRVLTLFREHHLVHAIEDGAGETKYELCLSHNPKHDEDTHVHFVCEHCHHIYCLHDTPIPAVSLPKGYVVHTANYLIKGLCPNCASTICQPSSEPSTTF